MSIEYLRTASGRRVPFNVMMVPVEQAPDGNAWTIRNVTLGGQRVPRAVPYRIDDPRAVRRVLVRHVCEPKLLGP